MSRTGRSTLFREEANGLLSSLEEFLLELERVPDDLELVRKVFGDLRAARESEEEDVQTLVDKAGMVYDKVRNGEIRVIRKFIELTLEARNCLRLIIDGQGPEGPALKTTFLGLKELVFEEAGQRPRSPLGSCKPANRGPRDASR